MAGSLALLLLLWCWPALWCWQALSQSSSVQYSGHLVDATANPIAGATLRLAAPGRQRSTTTNTDGSFVFTNVVPGSYDLLAEAAGRKLHLAGQLTIPALTNQTLFKVQADGTLLQSAGLNANAAAGAGSGGEKLSAQSVSELPLNKRDLGQLLLLAAGTSTDANGASNFTQQFAINGQRGVEATFALDGADISDPEMGGATFSNFNVDAVAELKSSSGWLPAEVGRGAAGLTNILTRSGSNAVHGSVFEFLRNSSLDARNYFDHPSIANPGRIPPFRRNEFGFTNGGPVFLPHLYDGRDKTFYFVEYQGFRQVLGTTQVLPVPTAEERAGRDTLAFAGDTLLVPVNSQIAPILARYPLPNSPQGPFGAHTYATSSKVTTIANQFSIRLDEQVGKRDHFFARFSLDNLTGPTTNPDQTVIDPTFGVQYIDRQRNVVFTHVRTASERLNFETSFSITRSTPSFPTPNRTDPALVFNDGLYEAFNSAAGSVMSAFGNLFQLREDVAYTRGSHSLKFGAEARLNRDTTFFGTAPNGSYTFGGGTAYAPVDIPSASGTHNIRAGDPLPDTLSALLTGSPFSYSVAVAPSYFSNGPHIGPAAINRSAFEGYAQDTWKITPRLTLNYGLRYELYTPISERAKRTSALRDVDGQQRLVVNPQPGYATRRNNWAPRMQLDWQPAPQWVIHLGGAITTIPPNIWQDNSLTGATPFVIYPRLTAEPGSPLPYGFTITPSQLPRAYTPGGQDIFASGDPKKVPANTVLDVDRYERAIAALSPGQQITPLNLSSIDVQFGNAALYTWTLGVERQFGKLSTSASYVGTAGSHLPRFSFLNGYPGATEGFAPYTEFDSAGRVTGGFGTETVLTDTSHSSYHALQLSAQGMVGHGGPGVQASYTWSKSLDDVSSVLGAGAGGGVGVAAPAMPQNPFDTHPERGPSSFDVTHGFTLSLAQDLHLDQVQSLRFAGRKVTRGWELLSISSISSGAPFTVYSGIQQTGAGAAGTDRPDQIARPKLSTARRQRQDYFGRGTQNASFFSIPINLPGGTGPNHGRFGTLGRNSFRGPAYYDFDFSLIKDTAIGTRRSGSELIDLQFRSEFFNIFNIANLGLPANNVLGSGFGQISRTAGTSRQIQFSLKLIY